MKKICRVLGIRLNEAQKMDIESIADASEETVAYLPVKQEVHRFRRWLFRKEEQCVDVFFDIKK